MAAERHILHLFATFTAGGPQVRTATIVKALPAGAFRHTVVGLDGDFSCSKRLEGRSDVAYADPPRKGGPLYFARLGALVAQTEPDLVLTYNWGAIEAIPGARLRGFRRILHAEDGFGPEEAQGQLARRVWFRRMVLPLATKVIVPSRRLLEHAEKRWRVPPAKRVHVDNGIDVAHFAPASGEEASVARAALRAKWGVGADALVVGTVARLRAEKGLDLLLRAFWKASRRPELARARLVIVGDGPEEAALRALARELRLAGDGPDFERVSFAGPVADARDCYRAFDLFALSSRTEQMPIALVEAMACGLPVVSRDVGDVLTMVAHENRPWVLAQDSPERFAAALAEVLPDEARRRALGEANRLKATSDYRVETMVERYRRLYEETLSSS
jgi:glycosyltransferase involved in cell wall biosynthesis